MGEKTNLDRESFDQEKFDEEFFSEEAGNLGLMSGVEPDEEDPEEEDPKGDESEEEEEDPDDDEENDEDPDQDGEEQEEEDDDEESSEGRGQPQGSTKDGEPILTLNHQGREIPISSKEDLILLAQQGLDYTVKTQQLSPFRKAIEYLNRNPEAMARLQAQMEGKEVPEEKEEPKKKPVPEQREDETYEEYVARVARESAREELEQRERAETEREQQVAGTMTNLQRDPLFKATVTLMKTEMARGNISQEEYRRADNDPRAFSDLYGRYRSAAAAIIRNTGQQGGKKKDDKKPPAKKTRKTFTEKSRARKRSLPRNPREITDKAIEQMGSEDLEQLIERVKGGGGTF